MKKKRHHKQSKKTSYGLEESTCQARNTQKMSKHNLQLCPQISIKKEKAKIIQQRKE